MILKPRDKSITHQIYDVLNYRWTLTGQHRRDYLNQISGHKGESVFDEYMAPYFKHDVVLNGLNLKNGNAEFQTDTVVVTAKRVLLYEVKNYSGAYHYRDGSFYSESGYRMRNPLGQADRADSLLYNLMLNRGYQLTTAFYVVFINPNFSIEKLPPNPALLFPNQLHSHFRSVATPHNDQKHQQLHLAQEILKLHNDDYRPHNLPDYRFDELKKGIFCPKCFSTRHTDTRKMRTCLKCGHIETITHSIQRSSKEFSLLFPDVPLTTNLIYEWIAHMYSKRRVRYALKAIYQSCLTGPRTYYI
ncbi:nuclease-related domain-containing protein [Atopococcus tabaci]|uniref:nuclease-related domain-containing protein n=1 Tax=Atopococcus tabaci TaxID=269774 RepID=UPI00040C920F|nr:nuclease-related domain-containing protein [Atopococcus tabaci]